VTGITSQAKSMVSNGRNLRRDRETAVGAFRLFGREAERAALGALLDRARRFQSNVLVLRGPPGIGKSALMRDAVARAEGFRILEATGVESESGLAFAGLHQLLRPVRGLVDQIPEPQAAALLSAVGMTRPGGDDDPFLVGAGLLSILAAAAEERPLLCVVEDANLLDAPSASALIFAARRFDAEPIALLVAARDNLPSFEASGLPELVLGGLDREAAEDLVADRATPPIAASVQAELVERAGGNPLALLELPLALDPEQLAGRSPVADPFPLTESLEEAFLTRVVSLAAESQKLLLIAATEGTGDLQLIERAAGLIGLEEYSLEECEAAGLIRLSGEGVEFRHALVGSAVYQHAAFTERQSVHLALAEALTDERDADRRAWHLAAGTSGPNDEVADELERSAERARTRGGYASAAAALGRAASLTMDEERRAHRQLGAAEAAWVAGQSQMAAALVEEARGSAKDPVARADIERLRGSIEMGRGSPVAAARIFLAAASEIEELDLERAAQLLVDAAIAGIYQGEYRYQAEVSVLAEKLRGRAKPGHFELTAAAAFGLLWQSETARAQALHQEVIQMAETADNPRRFLWASISSFNAGDDAKARAFANRDAEIDRRRGAVSALSSALARVALVEIIQGQLSSAKANATEGLSLAYGAGLETLAGNHRALLAWIAGLLGESDAATLSEDTLRRAREQRNASQAGAATIALGELELGRGRALEAVRHLETLAIPVSLAGQPYLSLIATPTLVEAAVRGRRPDIAASALPRYEEWVTRTGSISQRPLLERCRALLADGPAMQGHFEEALRLHSAGDNPFERARTELLYGERLRRAGLRRKARAHLRSAFRLFDELGASLRADQAQEELRASGERLRARGAAKSAKLTPQELQIARFVATGATNKEVAEQLFLSPRTVDAHLRNVFRKFGITSRGQLASLDLGDAAGAPKAKNSAVSPMPD
jgi:DNA-binding CsgD family transcriptional regulator